MRKCCDMTNAFKKVKVCFYIAQYPVRWTTQTSLHFSRGRPVQFRHQLDFSGKHPSHAAITHEDYPFTFPPLSIARYSGQGFMQDENVACHDIGKLSFERAVGCFGTPQLERAARFPMPQLERVTCFAMPQLERATRFPNVPSRVATRFRMFQFEHE